jgi:hypothetical protein
VRVYYYYCYCVSVNERKFIITIIAGMIVEIITLSGESVSVQKRVHC